jgi:hypothetical protein
MYRLCAGKLVLCLASKLVRKKSRFNTRGEKKKSKPKLDWRLLRNDVIWVNYNNAITSILQEKEKNASSESIIQTAEAKYTKVMDATLQAAEDTIQGPGRMSKDWYQHSEPICSEAIRL